MAKKEMTAIKAEYNKITKVAYEIATSVADGFEIKLRSADESTFILVTNDDASDKKVTIKAPTKGSYAAASSDLVETLSAGETAVIRVESARYANNDGTIVIIPESVNVKAVVVI